jgi:hypothetical protein
MLIIVRSGLTLWYGSSQFYWPSHIYCSIATAILEDCNFVELFL